MVEIWEVISDLLRHIYGHAAWALLGAVAAYALLVARRSYTIVYWRERMALRKLLLFSRGDRIVVVLPRREQPSVQKTVGAVAYEDMVACILVERCFMLAGWREEQIEIVSNDVAVANVAYKRENLVLLCSPRRNPLTAEALATLKRQNRLDCWFDTDPDHPEELCLHLAGANITSPSYREAEPLLREGKSGYEGPLNDCALLARFENPWEPGKSVLILAGLRAIGTWGAARALRQRARELVELTGAQDFAVTVKCKYERWKVKEYDFGEVSRILPKALETAQQPIDA